MANDQDSDRHAQIQALHKAACLERAQTLRRLALGVLSRRSSVEAWSSGQPALAEGGDGTRHGLQANPWSSRCP
jgi:hypothetical protein